MNEYNPMNHGQNQSNHSQPGAHNPYSANGWEYYNGAWHPTQHTAPVHPAAAVLPTKTGGKGKRVLGGIAFLVACALAGFGGALAASHLSGEGQTVVYKSTQAPKSAAHTASADDKNVSDIAASAGESVVSITTENMVADFFTGGRIVSGAGSGVIISEDGYIITNNHVAAGAQSLNVTLPDGSEHEATLISSDPSSDIAVLKIDVSGLVPAVLGDSSSLEVGEFCLAIGNPLGTLGGTVTEGIISALNREISIDGATMNLLQMSAPVSPGNSGGGLFNSRGELIGVVNAKSSGAEAENLGFAIPVNTAMDVAESLIENGYVSGRPGLGVSALTVQSEQEAAQYGVPGPGVYITAVGAGSAAQTAGLQIGDQILAVDGQPVSLATDLNAAIKAKTIGDSITLTILRDGQEMDITATLAELVPTA